jgi:hypothetical protein
MPNTVNPIEQARERTNFPRLMVAVFMFLAGIYVFFIFFHYLAIIQTYQTTSSALAAWLLLIGFVTNICLLVDTALIILPPIFAPFAFMRLP